MKIFSIIVSFFLLSCEKKNEEIEITCLNINTGTLITFEATDIWIDGTYLNFTAKRNQKQNRTNLPCWVVEK